MVFLIIKIRLEIINRNISGKPQRKKTRKYSEVNAAYWNLRDVNKAVFGDKFILLNTYIRKEERSLINGFTFHLKEPGKIKKVN